MRIHFGRIIADGIPVALILAYVYQGLEVLVPYVQFASFDYEPLSARVLMIILGIFYFVECFMVSGRYSSTVYVLLGAFITQNWLIGLVAGILNVILAKSLTFLRPN